MASIKKWIDFQLKLLKDVGGYQAAFRRLLREGNVRQGTLVGTDEFGNKYFENNENFVGRNRFVEYPYVDRYTADGSQVPPEWHRWLHYMTDDPPTKVAPPDRKFYVKHEKNFSGSKQEYVPYSTTKQKIHAWQPPSLN